MRWVVLVACAGCLSGIDPEWQLDHDRIVAIRATPPHIPLGGTSTLDGLIAHKGEPTDLEQPIAAGAPTAVEGLGDAVTFDGQHWNVAGFNEAQLDQARLDLGLAAGAPVPLDVIVQFADSGGVQLVGKKTVWLGDSADNPASVGDVQVGGTPPGASITIPSDVDVPLSTDTDTANMVDWLTSCGTMHDDDEHAAFVHVQPSDSHAGELALVVRDPLGGVVWQVWPISAQ
ncbi:MAG TPA: hypothetical protein VLX92_02745 [Kofleriaceae bacterium]|nr:hypothetical protein [Kofleriaceae bacterium]